MGRKPNWTQEEIEFLCERWGVSPLKTIRSTLGKSENAINCKVRRLGLGAFLDNGEYITYNQLMKALRGVNSNSYANTSWIENRGFPIKYKKVNNCRFKIVYLKDFWKWAEDNRNFIDFSKVVRFSLGPEPDWVEDQRNADKLKRAAVKMTPWTKTEDKRLIDMLKTYQYSYNEIATALCRTEGAVVRRMSTLGLKDRPVKADNHRKWTEAEIETLEKMILQGYSSVLISEKVGRGQKAVQGMIYRRYGTENMDKARKYIKEKKHGTERHSETDAE